MALSSSSSSSSRSWSMLALVVVVGMLVPSIYAAGNLKVDNIFASAGPLITVNRLTTTVATVSQSSTDTISAAPSEFVVNAPQLAVDSSYVTVNSNQDLNVVSSGGLSLSSASNLRLSSGSIVEVSSTTSDVTINAPQSATTILSHSAHLDGNAFTFSSGKGGFDIQAQGGPVDILSPLSSVLVSSGGAGDIAAVGDITFYSANGVLQVTGDTTSLYAKERVTVFADSALTATAPTFVVRAADDLGVSSAAINVQGGSVVVGSKTQEVTVTAGTNVVATASGALSITGSGEGVTFQSVGGGGSIVAAGTLSLVSTSGTGVVSIHSDSSVSSSSLSATATGTILTLDGDQSVTVGGTSLSETTTLSGSDLQFTSGTTSTFTAGQITATGNYLFSSAKAIKYAGKNLVQITGNPATGLISMDSSGDQAITSTGPLVLNNALSTSVFAIGGAYGCGDVQLNAQSAGLSLQTFSIAGGAASVVAQGSLSANYPGAISFSAGSDANGALLFDAGNLKIQSIALGSTALSSSLGAIDYLLAGTIGWSSSQITFNAQPGPVSIFGNTYLGLIGAGAVSLTGSDTLSIVSTTNIQSNSFNFLLQSQNSNAALNIHGAASFNASNSIQITASDKFIAANTPLNSNLDSVSFTGGVGIFTAANKFDFTALRKDVTVNAGQDVLITTSLKNIDFETIDGGFGYINAATRFSSSASDSLIAGENIRTSSAGSTSLLAFQVLAQITDRGITTYSVNQDTSVSGLSVSFSSDSDLVGTFGRDETINTYGALTVSSGAGTSVVSSAGTVSISSRVDQLSVTTGRNAYFQTGGLTDSTVDFEVSQTSTLVASNLFSAQVSQDSLRFHGSTISVTANKRYSVVGDNQASYSGTTTTVSANSARTQVYGGAINFSTANNNLFVEGGTDIIVRSELGSNYGFLVDAPAVAGIEDTINLRTKRHLVWNSGQSIAIHSGSNTTFTVNRLFVDDDDDGDGGMVFTANTGRVLFTTPTNHNNDIWIASGGAVSITAQSVSQPLTWTGAYDTYAHAARAISITGHTGGVFSVNGDLGYVRLDSDAGVVNINSNGGKATFSSTLPNNNGGAPVFVVAQNQISSTSASAQFTATGASPLSLPNAPGRTDGGQLVSDPSNIVGISLRTTDSSGNIAIDARNAGLTYSSGRTFYIDGPNNATLTSDSGFSISTGTTTSIDSEDGSTQLQGVTGTTFVTTNQLAFEASRLLSFLTQDQLSVTSAMSSVTFFSQSGNINLRTQFFNPITVNAQAVSINAGGSGADITATDAVAATAGLATQLSGTRGVTVQTIGGKILLQSETAAPNQPSTITAQQNVTLQGGSRLTVQSADTVLFSGLQNTTFTATGGGISIGASVSASLTAVHSLELKSGTSTNQKTTADRTLLQTKTLSISGSQRLTLDPTSFLRIGTSTNPTVNINGGGTPIDYGIIVSSQGNILLNTDTALSFAAQATASVDSGYEGSEFVSTTDTLVSSTLGNIFIASPNGRLDLSAGTTATITAATTSSISSGGLLSIASIGANLATSSVNFLSLGTLSLASPLISLHSPQVTLQTTGGTGTIAASVQRGTQFNAGGQLIFSQTTAAAVDSISVTSGDWQLYQSDAVPVVGSPALALSAAGTSNIAVTTNGVQSDIDLITLGPVSLTSNNQIKYTSTGGIEIDAGKGVNPGFGSNVQFLANQALSFTANQAVFNASQSVLLSSITKDVTIQTPVGSGGRISFDSESTLSFISATNDITMSATNVASFSAGVDLLFNYQKLTITASTGQVANIAGGLFSVNSGNLMTLTATGNVVIPNPPDQPNLGDTFRVTVDAPNIPLTLTAPNDVAFASKTGNFLTAGQENGERGYVTFNAGTELDAVSATGSVIFQSIGNADQIGGTADTTFSSATTTITATNAGIAISGTGTRPDAGYVAFSGAQQTYSGNSARITSSQSAIFESAGALSLKASTSAFFVATGPVDSNPKAAYGVSVDSVSALTVNPGGLLGIYPATDANLIGQTVGIKATTLTLTSFSPSNDGSSTGIDMISHGPNGISFSSTGGFTWTAGGVLSIESEPSVSIQGTTITMNNPVTAFTSTFIHATQSITFNSATSDTITANQNLQFSAGTQLLVSTASQAIFSSSAGAITFTGDAGITVSGNINFTPATISQAVVGVDGVLFTTTGGNTLIVNTLGSFAFTAGSVKSKAPSGDINFESQSLSFNAAGGGPASFSALAGDNILGYSFRGETWLGSNINILAWNGGIQLRSISIAAPFSNVLTVTGSNTITINAGTWQTFRQHRRLRFFESCTNTNTGTRFGVATTLAYQLGTQTYDPNWCYCPFNFPWHCTCPWEQSVANQIYWALADYGLINDPSQIPQ